MKKMLAFVIACLLVIPSFASVVPPRPAPLKASEVHIATASGKVVSLQELAHMKAGDFAKLSGRKMNSFHRLGFSLAQKKLRSNIHADGTINNKRMVKTFRRAADGPTGFHMGGFALGFFLGILGVVVAYVIKDEKNRNRVKWSWIGLVIRVVVSISLFLAFL
jgi:hypothetical protein